MNPVEFDARCPICLERKQFSSPDYYRSCRDGLRAPSCGLNDCVTRERSIADVLFSILPREAVVDMHVHEAAPGGRGLSLWLWHNVSRVVHSGYFPDHPFGDFVGHVRNEDLENQTFEDETFDLVLHLDVMEHLFNPFRALLEIERTLKLGGLCLFTAPTYPIAESSQVAFNEDGQIRIVGEPEYHGNPQGGGSLVTWRYGYDLPALISDKTGFDVKVVRQQDRSKAILGPMTEVYVLRRPHDHQRSRRYPQQPPGNHGD